MRNLIERHDPGSPGYQHGDRDDAVMDAAVDRRARYDLVAKRSAEFQRALGRCLWHGDPVPVTGIDAESLIGLLEDLRVDLAAYDIPRIAEDIERESE